jgi:signal transduction histidine kinase
MSSGLSPRTALIVFVVLVAAMLAQAVWWIVFMARLVDEKVSMAYELGATPDIVEQMQDQEISRQIMLGLEGVFFLIIIIIGAWLMYRALTRATQLKFHQQNFLMAVTHELKTPLASIRIYLDSLASEKVSHETKQTVFPRMKEDIDRLEKLVERILDAGRFERSGYHLHRETFSLSQLVSRRIEALKRVPVDLPIDISSTLEPDIEYFGDRVALSRAIDAIMENSLKYHDSQAIKIDINLTQSDTTVTLIVTDHGIGLSGSDRRDVFERFYRVGNELTRQTSGTGLGLYLCREIVRAHGGDIHARSGGAGAGAEFTITLKRSDSNEEYSAG